MHQPVASGRVAEYGALHVNFDDFGVTAHAVGNGLISMCEL
jgi:hypothetical protein